MFGWGREHLGKEKNQFQSGLWVFAGQAPVIFGPIQ
jgi:hypothetical protein